MSYSLATTRPEDQARAKSRLLTQAVEQIVASGAELDLSVAFRDILGHIIRANGLDQRDSGATAKAQAIAIVTLNLGLEYAAKGDVNKAVTALSRNPAQKIYAVGEKVVTELQKRVADVWSAAVISVRHRTGTVFYGVTDQATEDLMVRWATKGLSDHPFLPPGTLDEIETIKATLNRVERETQLAHKVNWAEILSDGDTTRFTAELFLRPSNEVTNPLGGIWKPFLLSIITQAMTRGWERNQKRLAFVDRDTIVEFVELVTFDFNRVGERAASAAMHIERVATKQEGRLFKEACTTEEVQEIFAFAQSSMDEHAREARRFCFEAEDLDAVSEADLDRFWRERLFLSSNVPYDVRVAGSDRSWQQLPQAKTLAALKGVVKNFAKWPPEQRENFFASTKLDPMLDAITEINKQVAELNALCQTLDPSEKNPVYAIELIRRTIDWSERLDLLLAWRFKARGAHAEKVEREAGALVRWTMAKIRLLYGARALNAFLGQAVRQIGSGLTEPEWTEIILLASADSTSPTEDVWRTMDEERQRRDFMKFRAQAFSIMLGRWEWAAVRDFFEPIFKARANDPKFTAAFKDWLDGGAGHLHSFIYHERWHQRFEALCKQYFGWPTSEDQRVARLPPGHHERRHLDAEIHREAIASIVEARPWEKLTQVSAFEELVELLTNFSLWPDEQQVALAFKPLGFDPLLDEIEGAWRQAMAIGRLRQAMKGPYQIAPNVKLAISKIIDWTNRAEVIIELGAEAQISRRVLLALAPLARGPVATIKRIDHDPELLMIALTNLEPPTEPDQWSELMLLAGDQATFGLIWKMMPGTQREHWCLRMPAGWIAGYYHGQPWETIKELLIAVIGERGADEVFAREFKTWLQGGSKKTVAFYADPAWKSEFDGLMRDQFGWLSDAAKERQLKALSSSLAIELGSAYENDQSLDSVLDRCSSPEAQAVALKNLWQSKGIKSRYSILGLITWSGRADLVVQMSRKSIGLPETVLMELIQKTKWTYATANQLKPKKLLAVALTLIGQPLTPKELEHLANKVGYYQPELARVVWNLMTPESRRRLFHHIPASQVSELYSDRPWLELKGALEQIFDGPIDASFKKRFNEWYAGYALRAFKPDPRWEKELKDFLSQRLYGEKPTTNG